MELDFSTTGLMRVLDDSSNPIHSHVLQNIQHPGILSASIDPAIGRSNISAVTFVDGGLPFVYDIRDITSPVYATPADLLDAIETAIAALY